MANADRPFGLCPIRHKNGAPYNGAVTPYYVPATYATALFVGDPVVVTGTSNTAEVEGYIPGSLPEINKATAAGGNYLTGAIVSFGLNRDDLSKKHKPALTESIVWVADDPDLIFEIQEDGDTTPLAATSVSANADLIFTASGSAVTGLSGAELDSDTVNTTATLQLRIISIVNRQDNAIGEFAKWNVAINLHTQRRALGA